jgi:hypothetical protein
MAVTQSTGVIYFSAGLPRKLSVAVVTLEAMSDLFAYFLK